MKARSSFHSKVIAAFTASIIVVSGLAVATWKLAGDAVDAANWVAHTHDVIHSLIRVKELSIQIELSTQNFRLTANPAFLAERDTAIAEREPILQQTRELVADNPQQQERWVALRAVTDERLAISRRTEYLRQTEGIQAATAYVAGAPLRETRQRMYALLSAMEVEERRLLALRIAEQLRARQWVTGIGVVAAVLLLVLLAASYWLIRRQLKETEASRQALIQSEQSLSTTLYSIGDAVLATDSGRRIVRMNRVAEQLTGWPLADAQGRPIDEVFHLVHEETREPAEIPVARVLATGQAQGLADHTMLVARNGSEYPIADSAAPIRDHTNQIVGVVLVFRDVRAERQAQRMIRQQNELLEQRVQERTAQLRASEDHLRNVISTVPATIAYVDAQQHFVYVNQQFRELFAPALTDFHGRSIREILGETRYAAFAPLIDNALRGEQQSYDWQPLPGVWQVLHYVPQHDAGGHVVGCYVLGIDITVRKQSEERIRALNIELEQRVGELENVSRALRTLSEGNRALTRAVGKEELIDSMCNSIVANGGYRMAAVWYCNDDAQRSMRLMAESGYPQGRDALEALQPGWGDDARGHGVVGTAVRTGQPALARDLESHPDYAPWRPHLHGVVSILACPLHVERQVIGVLAIYDDNPDAFGPDELRLLTELAEDLAFGIAAIRTQAERRKAEASAHRLTYFDPLTGLPNAAQLTDMLAQEMEAHRVRGRSFVLLQVNIGRLSEINDILGFGHGDELLKAFAERLCTVAHAPARVVRLRGDEFALLLPDSNTADADALVQRLEASLAHPFPIADISLDVSTRIGVVLYPQHGTTLHDLYRHMDIAMRQAKRLGVSHAFFDPKQHQHQPYRLALAGELRRAIEAGDLQLHVQPKVDMTDGRICGTEGLVRWLHPSRGMIMPCEFISLAERTGLITPLTHWVIDQAVHLARDWRQQGLSQAIAVNLSARNLRDENLLTRIEQLQAATGGLGNLLEIELTESTLMEDAEFALRVLQRLHEKGLRLYIDDFGTGYSSLSYLQKLPLDYIKIDQSFVRAMADSKDSASIVRSTIDLAHDIGRKVVAEGVETREHWQQLAAFGCDIAQGYLIARPMPATLFPDWLRNFHLSGSSFPTNG